MKVGILGTGFGSYHAKIYKSLEGVELVRIFGRKEDILKQLQEELHIAVTRNIYDVINDPEVDVVDICLPTKEHTRYIIEALAAGKHVFCETPLCCSREELVQIKTAEQRSGKRVFVDLFAKCIAEHQYIYDALQKNTYGALKSLTITRNTPPIWGPLGLDKIVTDLMLHDLDLSVWFLGMPVNNSVSGISGRKGEASVKVTLEYKDAFIYVEASSMMPKSYPFTVGFEAIFENGLLEYRAAFQPEGIASTCMEYTSEGKRELKLMGHDPYEQALKHVIQCCNNNEETILSASSAAGSLSIAFDLQDILNNK